MDLSHERRQNIAITVAAVASKGAPILMGTAMAVHVRRAGGSTLAVGLVLTLYFVGVMVCAPVWGAIADVTGRRRDTLLLASVLATVAVLPLLVFGGVWPRLGLRTLSALFAAGYLPTLLTIVSARGGAEQRGQAIGLFSSAQAVGSTAGQFGAGVLLGLVAPWSLYLVVAIASAIVVLAVLVIDDPTPATDRTLSRADIYDEVKTRLFPSKESRQHLHENGLMWLYVAVLLRNMTVMGTSSLLPVYLIEQIGLAEAAMGAILAINPAAQVLAMYLVGRVSDIAGRKPLVTYGMAGSGLYALFMAVAIIPDTLLVRSALIGAGMLLLGVGFAGTRVGAIAFIGDIAPMDRESELIGLRSTARGLGGVLGPALLGAVAMFTSIEFAYALGSLLAFVGTGIVVYTLVESAPATNIDAGSSPAPDSD